MAANYSSTLGEYGSRPTFVDPGTGKTYSVSYLTQAKKAAFEQWLRGEAMRAVMELKNSVSRDDYREMLRETTQDIASGAYAFTSELCARALGTPTGALAMAAVLFHDVKEKRQPTFEEMLDISSRHPDELRAVLDLVLDESKPKGRQPAEGPEGNAPSEPSSTSTP